MTGWSNEVNYFELSSTKTDLAKAMKGFTDQSAEAYFVFLTFDSGNTASNSNALVFVDSADTRTVLADMSGMSAAEVAAMGKDNIAIQSERLLLDEGSDAILTGSSENTDFYIEQTTGNISNGAESYSINDEGDNVTASGRDRVIFENMESLSGKLSSGIDPSDGINKFMLEVDYYDLSFTDNELNDPDYVFYIEPNIEQMVFSGGSVETGIYDGHFMLETEEMTTDILNGTSAHYLLAGNSYADTTVGGSLDISGIIAPESEVEGILIFGRGGDDVLDLSSTTYSVDLFGGSDNDILMAGSGGSRLSGVRWERIL